MDKDHRYRGSGPADVFCGSAGGRRPAVGEPWADVRLWAGWLLPEAPGAPSTSWRSLRVLVSWPVVPHPSDPASLCPFRLPLCPVWTPVMTPAGGRSPSQDPSHDHICKAPVPHVATSPRVAGIRADVWGPVSADRSRRGVRGCPRWRCPGRATVTCASRRTASPAPPWARSWTRTRGLGVNALVSVLPGRPRHMSPGLGRSPV